MRSPHGSREQRHTMTALTGCKGRWRIPAMVLALLALWVAPEAEGEAMVARKVPAVACDHRYGATATWSQSTDTAQANSFWWAEACAFRGNLAVTVFDIPFHRGSRYVPMAEREAAARTGRLSFQVYFASDSWFNPVRKAVTTIPDYYAKAWTQAGVDAGFQVEVGVAKRSRFPNHGQQLFECSAGRFGYDVRKAVAGEVDVLTKLVDIQTAWIRKHFRCPASAGGYRNGQTGAAYGLPTFLLGVRNSGATGDCSYGQSKATSDTLGKGRTPQLTHREAASLLLTTRAGDMERPREEVLQHCAALLRQAIAMRGWYRDFNHWHTSPRFELDLGEYYADQRATMSSHDVVCLGFGEALQHKFLRDMATVAAHETADGVELKVTYADPYGTLPLQVFHIPLSVRVDLRQTAQANREVSAGGLPIRKRAAGVVVVDVPFHGREETVTVRLRAVQGTDHYLDFSLPSIVSVRRNGAALEVQIDRPARLVLFTTPKGAGLRQVGPPARSHRLKIRHRLPLNVGADHDVYLGVITTTGQSILDGPLALRAP